jgi:hypothetical protein
LKTLLAFLLFPLLLQAQTTRDKVLSLRSDKEVGISQQLAYLAAGLQVENGQDILVGSPSGPATSKEFSLLYRRFYHYSMGYSVNANSSSNIRDEIAKSHLHEFFRSLDLNDAFPLFWYAWNREFKEVMIADTEGRIKKFLSMARKATTLEEEAAALAVLQEDYKRIRPILVSQFGEDLSVVRMTQTYLLHPADALDEILSRSRILARAKKALTEPEVRKLLFKAGILQTVREEIQKIEMSQSLFVARAADKHEFIGELLGRPSPPPRLCKGPISGDKKPN